MEQLLAEKFSSEGIQDSPPVAMSQHFSYDIFRGAKL